MSFLAYESINANKRLFIVIGLGLVGNAISKQLALSLSPVQLNDTPPSNWQDPELLSNQITQLIEQGLYKETELIWCAGKAGFGATDVEMKQEYHFYCKTLESIAIKHKSHITVNLISSAGGIYEGSGFVENINEISPARPYAHGKLQQENFLKESTITHRIYRVSSVYGQGGSRTGLINAMLNSAKQNQSMTIYANKDTLRDYIYSVDLANQIAEDVIGNAEFGTRIIASGRATSINMLLNFVRKITRKSVPATFHENQSNDKNILFSQHIVTKQASSTSLEEGIRLLYKNLLLAE